MLIGRQVEKWTSVKGIFGSGKTPLCRYFPPRLYSVSSVVFAPHKLIQPYELQESEQQLNFANSILLIRSLPQKSHHGGIIVCIDCLFKPMYHS